MFDVTPKSIAAAERRRQELERVLQKRRAKERSLKLALHISRDPAYRQLQKELAGINDRLHLIRLKRAKQRASIASHERHRRKAIETCKVLVRDERSEVAKQRDLHTRINDLIRQVRKQMSDHNGF